MDPAALNTDWFKALLSTAKPDCAALILRNHALDDLVRVSAVPLDGGFISSVLRLSLSWHGGIQTSVVLKWTPSDPTLTPLHSTEEWFYSFAGPILQSTAQSVVPRGVITRIPKRSGPSPSTCDSLLVLEDLKDVAPVRPSLREIMTLSRAQAALSAIAVLHSTFLNHPQVEPALFCAAVLLPTLVFCLHR